MGKNRPKYRIAIVGIGGVGGYIGGLLAAKYHDSKNVEVIFVVKGEHKKNLISNGLKLITGEKEQVIFPDLVSDKVEDIETVDLLICCVKSYDLLEATEQFRNCISSSTLIMPLENGVDASDKIRPIISNANIVSGCIYLNSKIIQPGVVKQVGNLHSLYFGSNDIDKEQLDEILILLKDAGIEAFVSDNIQQALWEKFVFISAIATLTSYANITIGEVVANQETKQLLLQLINEAKALANAKGIELAENISEKIIEKASTMPFEATSSMHTDIMNGKRSEVNSLTEYVVEEGKRLNVSTPTYALMLAKLMAS